MTLKLQVLLCSNAKCALKINESGSFGRLEAPNDFISDRFLKYSYSGKVLSTFKPNGMQGCEPSNGIVVDQVIESFVNVNH